MIEVYGVPGHHCFMSVASELSPHRQRIQAKRFAFGPPFAIAARSHLRCRARYVRIEDIQLEPQDRRVDVRTEFDEKKKRWDLLVATPAEVWTMDVVLNCGKVDIRAKMPCIDVTFTGYLIPQKTAEGNEGRVLRPKVEPVSQTFVPGIVTGEESRTYECSSCG